MVKTTWRSDRLCSSIFGLQVVVYYAVDCKKEIAVES